MPRLRVSVCLFVIKKTVFSFLHHLNNWFSNFLIRDSHAVLKV